MFLCKDIDLLFKGDIPYWSIHDKAKTIEERDHYKQFIKRTNNENNVNNNIN